MIKDKSVSDRPIRKKTAAKSAKGKAEKSASKAAGTAKATSAGGKSSKPTARKASKPKATVARSKPAAPASPTPDERHRMIAEAAYFRAQARGFAGGHDLCDWLLAERDVRDRLAEQASRVGA